MIDYFYDDLKDYRKDKFILNIFDPFYSRMNSTKYTKSSICLIYLATILLLGTAILSLSQYISTFIYYVLSLIILLFCLRTNQYNRDIEELKIKLEFKKNDINKTLLFKLCPNLKNSRAKSNLNELVIKNLFYNSVRTTFGIIFFFILLGAPGALVYKLIDFFIYSDEFKIDTKNKQDLKKSMFYIDFIPVRLTSYCFSVVSNYDQVIDRINNLKLSSNPYLSNIEFINQTGESVYDGSQKEADQIMQIQNILSRTLIAWLGIIFLLAIAGVFI